MNPQEEILNYGKGKREAILRAFGIEPNQENPLQKAYLSEDGYLLDNETEELEKAAKGAGLVKKIITNKAGKRQTVWVNPSKENEKKDKNASKSKFISSAQYQKEKKKPGFNSANWKWNSDKSLYEKKLDSDEKQGGGEDKKDIRSKKQYPAAESGGIKIKQGEFSNRQDVSYVIEGDKSTIKYDDGTKIELEGNSLKIGKKHFKQV